MDAARIEHFRRFIEQRIAPDLNTGCWLWTGAVQTFGYGNIFWIEAGKTRRFSAHRAAWIVANGDIPPGMAVCHRCDTPACVNPDHLFLGSQRQNMHDMFAKGRHERHGQKLSDDQVRAIRADRRSCARVAKDHGVSTNIIWLVKRRKTYKRIADDARAIA